MIGSDIRSVIPSISLDLDGDSRREITYKQRLTGKNRSGVSFPLCLVVSRHSSQGVWQIVIWTFLNLSGLIILNNELRITNCNYQFTKFLFGATKDNVLNQKITKFIPKFCEDIKHLTRSYEGQTQAEMSECSWRSEGKKCRLSMANQCRKDRHASQSKYKSFGEVCPKSWRMSSHLTDRNRYHECTGNEFSPESNLNIRLSKSDYDIHLESESSYYTTEDKSISSHMSAVRGGCRDSKMYNSEELTRAKQKNVDYYFDYKQLGLKEGYFFGNGKHWDGNDIDIYYKVKIISFGDKLFYCVWISREPWEFNDANPSMPATVTGSSSVISTSVDDSTTRNSSCNDDNTRHSSVSLLSHNDEALTGGEYSEHYTNIEQIGKGAFGYVKTAFRHSDGLIVVTKFIKKHKINVQSWVYDTKWSMKIPLEISLLMNLKHPNIIEVLDVFHNDSFFQLVMKKHGAGMDLFEFIERKPNCDERLNSYIFRQIISAVEYLDSIGVLHRDIKDENVIINEKFEVKLIDFGSAAFKPCGKMFSIFYGTVEYCSPEVLQGNKYRGPELEIWALGVTLYVLIFGENPFYDVQETIKGEFSIPIPISSQLFDLLHKMLEKDVESRICIGRVASHPWITQHVDIQNYRFEEIVHCSEAEADPPRFVTEFSLTTTDQNLDGDADRTIASSNSFCSLQTTENTENFDENLPDLGSDFMVDDSMFKSSTPASSSKARGDMTKSAGALNRVCEGPANFKGPICDRCSCKSMGRKRFSLDINILKRLSSGSKCSESECDTRNTFSEKLELELISDMDEMKLASDENKSYMYDSDSYSLDRAVASRCRSVSRDTEESNQTAYPEFCETSDNDSCDGEQFFWDAENDKAREEYV
ncbi:UNVERIFIED_CONTAM: hypothetical protein PYX00_007515 [Menopon gallinae]